MKLKYIIIYLLLISSNTISAQVILLKGKVVDKKNNLKLSGVTIKVGTDATISDENGYFTLKAQLRTLTEKGINFSLIGYLSMRLIYEPNHFYEVELVESTIQLNEVIIGRTGEDIIKKAIKKIPDNYPDRAIVIKGILRTQSWRNKSEYFKSDAIVKAYIPPYGGSEKSTVTVLQNHIDAIQDRSLRYLNHIGNYNLIDFQDIAHNRYILDKISKKRKFDYQLVGRQVYNNHKVFVINTTVKDTSKVYDKIDATLYIDTVSYAFVAANIFIYNWVQPGALTKKMTNYRVGYEKIGQKWFLQETHYVGESEYRTQVPKTMVDFIRTEIDSSNIEKIPYKDIIQKSDDIQLVDKSVSEEKWAKNEGLFRMAESDGRMAVLPAATLDTIRENNAKTNPPNQKIKKPFGVSILDYISKDNIRSVVGLTNFPVVIKSLIYTVPESANYGLGFGGNFRVYRNFFFGYQGSTNFWNRKHINLRTTVLRLSNEFVFNKTSKSITLAPYIGYERMNINYNKNKINYNSFDYGLTASFELTHKKALFLSSGFNPGLDTSTLNDLTITPTHYTIGSGFVFKL
jgi:hypothetical protein